MGEMNGTNGVNGTTNLASDHDLKPKQTKSGVLHRSLHEAPLAVSHGSGIYLTLKDGRQILDASCGAAVSCLGHGNKEVIAAIADQMSRLSYCHSLFFSVDVGEQLADSLLASTEHKMSKVFVISSGSEAIEASLKMSRQYFLELDPPQPERVRFIARQQSYHGTTLGALGVGGHVARRKLYEPMLITNTSFVSPCYAYRGMSEGEKVESYVKRLAEELDEEFQRVGPGKVCAFIAETVVGAALGCVPFVPGYFKAMKAVCDKHGALLIMDEIMSGMGRSGHLNAWQDEDVGVVPDILTIGKGLGGGYAAVAGMIIGPKVFQVLDKGTGAFQHGQTYQGHPISYAAALAVNKIISQPEMMPHVRQLGQRLERGLKFGLKDHPFVGDIRGKGLFWGIEFVQDKKTKEPFDPSLQTALAVHESGMKEPFSMSIYPGSGTVDGRRGDHVILAPAYTCTEEEIDLICRKTIDLISDFFTRRQSFQPPDLASKTPHALEVGPGGAELYEPEEGTLLATG